MRLLLFTILIGGFATLSFSQDERSLEILNWVDEYGEDDLNRSLDTLKFGLKRARMLGETKAEVRFLLGLSQFVLIKLNNVSSCSEYLEKIRKLAIKKDNDPWILSRYHNGKGVLYYYEGSDKKKAFSEFFASQKIITENGLKEDPMLLNNYALAFLSDENSEKALQLFKKCRKIEEAKGDKANARFLITNASNIGVCYIYLNAPDSSEYYFKEAVHLAEETKQLSDDFHTKVYLGVFYEENGDFNNSLDLLDEAYSIINTSSSLGTKVILFDSYKEIFREKKEFGKALEYAELSWKYKDSLRSLKLSEQAFAMDYKLELDKVLAEKRISILENSVKEQSFKFRIAVQAAIIVLLFVVGIFIFYRLSKQKEVNRIKAENEFLEKERIRQQAELDLLRKEEELIQANVELNVQKNELSELKVRLQSHLDKSHDPEFDDLKHYLKQVQKTEKKADQLKYLDHVLSYSNSTFYTRLKELHPDLTEDEMRLATLIRLNLGADELLHVFNISRSSLNTKRYRIRKKLNLSKDASLEDYIMNL